MPIPGTKYGLRDLGNSFSRVRSDRFRSLVCTMAEQGRQASDLTTKLPNRTLHARPGVSVSQPLFALSSLVSHREDAEVARAGPSIRDHFCGSKAGVTFCLAMISIGSGLKSRTSQRCHNNCLTVEMENGAPPNYLATATPPTLVCPGAGGWRAILRPKN